MKATLQSTPYLTRETIREAILAIVSGACEKGEFGLIKILSGWPERLLIQRPHRVQQNRRSDSITRSGCEPDFATNAPLLLAAATGKAAAEIAVWLGAKLLKCLTEITGESRLQIEEANGFLNLQVDDRFLGEQLVRAQREGERYGATGQLEGQRINVEFVSADPTGPLPLSAGRLAAAGEALCRCLEFQGADVTREFFLNDVETSSKMRLLGESVAARYQVAFDRDAEPPEGALDDAFIEQVARDIVEREGNRYLLVPEAERISTFTHQARDAAVALQKQTLERFGVRFDVWTSEKTLHDDGRVDAVLQKLQDRGYIEERDGALWLKTTAFGDEANRPLRRNNGRLTYLASDIAYHVYKFERGFDRVINLWTAEHRTYIARTRAALQAAGCDAGKLEVLPCESVRLLHDGTPMTVGRGGGIPTLEDAMQELDTDILRFWFLSRDWNTVISIESDTAERDDETNPAYAVRLLPSRLATLVREAEALSGENESATDAGIESETERKIGRLVAFWPDEAQTAAERREPQRIARFSLELATAVRQMLNETRPGSGQDNARRLDLLRAAQVVAANALRIIGIELQEKF